MTALRTKRSLEKASVEVSHARIGSADVIRRLMGRLPSTTSPQVNGVGLERALCRRACRVGLF